jgi:glycosyltransferase involved in cell wall biosynthesis
MADALVRAYGCRRPTVIRNVFPLKEREAMDGKWKDRPEMARWMPSNDPRGARPKEAPVSIHWFSQTVGPGRGLETLFQALDGLEGNWELHLRGNLKGYEGWLERVCPASVKGKMKVHGLVENEELLSRIAEHDIGFAGELGEPASRNLTITNKFFQYLQAGLAVVASETTGQREAAKSAPAAVMLFAPGDSLSLREKLRNFLTDNDGMNRARSSAWQAGLKMSWGNESTRLLGSIGKGL